MQAKHMVSGGMHLRIVAHYFPAWRGAWASMAPIGAPCANATDRQNQTACANTTTKGHHSMGNHLKQTARNRQLSGADLRVVKPRRNPVSFRTWAPSPSNEELRPVELETVK